MPRLSWDSLGNGVVPKGRGLPSMFWLRASLRSNYRCRVNPVDLGGGTQQVRVGSKKKSPKISNVIIYIVDIPYDSR